jgi:DNA-3-methyladenine glycosylase II
MSRFLIKTPPEFSAKLCVEFLLRSPKELLHRVEGDRIMKLILYGEQLILFSVTPVSNGLRVEVLTPEVEREHLDVIRQYVRFWFDLDTDLKPFYRLAKSDELLKDIVKRYAGYRIVGQPDLYESLVWAVLGQQINLSFAYQLKQRLVEKYGYCLSYGGQTYYAFPSPVENKTQYLSFLKACFSQPRKLMISNLQKTLSIPKESLLGHLQKLEIGEKVRAEELTLTQFLDLYRSLGYK